MTLPQPDKPVVTDKIKEILSHTSENLLALDSTIRPAAYYVVRVTNDMSTSPVGLFSQDIVGVGFQPSVIFFVSSYPDTHTMSIGIYAASDANLTRCLWFNYYTALVPGVTRGLRKFQTIWHQPGGYDPLYVWKVVPAADGFRLYWANSHPFIAGIVTTHAFCIK